MKSQRVVTEEEAKQFASSLGYKYYESSAKEDTNISDIFTQLANDLVDLDPPSPPKAVKKSVLLTEIIQRPDHKTKGGNCPC